TRIRLSIRPLDEGRMEAAVSGKTKARRNRASELVSKVVNLCPRPMAGSSATDDREDRLIRALHVIPSVSAKHGGPSAAMPALARALTQAGVTVTIASTDDDGRGRRADVAIGTEVQYADGVRSIYFRKNTDFYKVSLGLTRWLWDHVADYDVVHIHALFSYAST